MITEALQKTTELAGRWAEADADKDKLEDRKKREQVVAAGFECILQQIRILRLRQKLLPLQLERLDAQLLQDVREVLKVGKMAYQRQQVGAKNTLGTDLKRFNKKFSEEIKHHAECFSRDSKVIETQQALEVTNNLCPGAVPSKLRSRLIFARRENATLNELQDNLEAQKEAELCLKNSPLEAWQRQLLQRITVGQATLLNITPEELSWLQRSDFAKRVKLRYEF